MIKSGLLSLTERTEAQSFLLKKPGQEILISEISAGSSDQGERAREWLVCHENFAAHLLRALCHIPLENSSIRGL